MARTDEPEVCKEADASLNSLRDVLRDIQRDLDRVLTEQNSILIDVRSYLRRILGD